eukprot:jgi/Botrbrau1/18958/Bobra.0524s0001.1
MTKQKRSEKRERAGYGQKSKLGIGKDAKAGARLGKLVADRQSGKSPIMGSGYGCSVILDAHACVQYRTSDMQKGDGCISQALHDIGLKFMHSI